MERHRLFSRMHLMCLLLALGIMITACQAPPATSEDSTTAQGSGTVVEEPTLEATEPHETQPTEPDPPKEDTKLDVTNVIADYVNKYADTATFENWMATHFSGNIPPVYFKVDGKESSTLAWERTDGQPQAVVDYPEQDYRYTRVVQEITYTAAVEQIKVVMTLTTYPGYPIVEYDATLYNTADRNSPRLTELKTINSTVQEKEGHCTLHVTRGGVSYNEGARDYEPLAYQMTEDKSVTVGSYNGRPTWEYLPNFNIENREQNTGTIFVMNWQGSWEATFDTKDDGIHLIAGQVETDVVLQENENMRFPGGVLLFYKGDWYNGQNIYRRWLYQCNLFRDQGVYMKETNVLVCGALYEGEASDLAQLELYERTGLLEMVDKFNIDAGWYDMEGHDWTYTGNWYSSPIYPNGLKAISDRAHELGLQFALWMEPEHLYSHTSAHEELGDAAIAIAGSSVIPNDRVPQNTIMYLDYSNPKAVDWAVDLISHAIEEYGVDQYRQDHNFYPQPAWDAMDNTQSKNLSIPRTGYTENHAASGYVEVFKRLVEKYPQLYVDACAAGGMRYDLETSRFSFLHTRSDWWSDPVNAQCQVYGATPWILYSGTGFTPGNFTMYNVRSHLGNSIGVGASSEAEVEQLKSALTEWKSLAEYLFFDFYALSDYSRDEVLSMQWDSPEEGIGMAVTYFRNADSFTLFFRNLDPNAEYLVWNRDKADVVMTMSGKDLMEGKLEEINAAANSAIIYEYRLKDGEDTSAFQKEEVSIGLGSTDFDPSQYDTTLQDIEMPTPTKTYGFSDEDLKNLYTLNPNADHKASFVCVDFRSTGGIYQITKDVYEELQTTGEPILGGWSQVKRETIFLEIAGTSYVSTYWDSATIQFRLYFLTRKIDDTYFLWFFNSIPLGDPDGAWTNWNQTFSYISNAGNEEEISFTLHLTGDDTQMVIQKGSDSSGDGMLYQINEEIYSSFVYTGKGFYDENGQMWAQIKSDTIGLCMRTIKAPSPTENVAALTLWLGDLGENVTVLACKSEDGYYLLIKGYDRVLNSLGSLAVNDLRTLLVWKQADGTLCQQSYIYK